MKQHVTIVPSDNLVIVDGEALRFDFKAPEGVHAIQWHDGSGHVEWTGKNNTDMKETDYEAQVAPFGELWEEEKARLDEEAAAAEAARIAEYNSEESRAARIRSERDLRLGATDYLVTVDYPLDAEKLELVKTYRQALRDIPQQEGFPWSGEVDDQAIPWPVIDEAATTALR